MEAAHKNFIRRNFPEMAEKVFQFSEMIGKEYDVDDPISSSLENYTETAQELRSIMVSGFKKILKLSIY